MYIRLGMIYTFPDSSFVNVKKTYLVTLIEHKFKIFIHNAVMTRFITHGISCQIVGNLEYNIWIYLVVVDGTILKA